jgi:hypothetical protein
MDDLIFSNLGQGTLRAGHRVSRCPRRQGCVGVGGVPGVRERHARGEPSRR